MDYLIQENQLSKHLIEQSTQFHDGKFHNKNATNVWEFGKMWSALKEFTSKRSDPVPTKPVPLQMLEKNHFQYDDNQAFRFTKLGHSTILLQFGSEYWLTDPVFSKRASPVQWAGPKRFHPVPVELEALPEIEGVVISHNHYDHLDRGSILHLKDRVKHFVVPLGIGDTLLSWGVSRDKIHELDWWQSISFNSTEIVATPAQHFSGRGVLDGDKTLWASWVFRSPQGNVFFSGDSGYFDGFRQIGEKFGPFDVAFVECGAYHQSWRNIHMLPEDSLQAALDVKARLMVPIHNGTFDLSTHSWYDPMEKISKLAEEANQPLILPMFGQIVDARKPMANTPWWREAAGNNITFGEPVLGLK